MTGKTKEVKLLLKKCFVLVFETPLAVHTRLWEAGLRERGRALVLRSSAGSGQESTPAGEGPCGANAGTSALSDTNQSQEGTHF